MITKKITIIICCLLVYMSKGLAQDSLKQIHQWTLQECLDYAKQNNIQLNNLRLTEKSTEQDLLLSKAARQPNLNGSVTQSFTNSKNANPVIGGFQTQSSFAGNYSLNSSLTIYNGGYINNDIKQKDLLQQSAGLNVDQTQNDISLQVTQAFLNILLSKENIIYLQDLVNTSQAQQLQGQQRFDAGSIAKKDLVQLQAQTANDKYTLVTAQNALRQNTLTLKQLLQLPSDTTFEIQAPDTLIAKQMYASLSEAQSAALQTRPEVKNSMLGIDIAQLDLEKARAGLRPTLSLGGSLSTGYSDNQSTKYFTQLDNNFFQRVGLTLSIPIFNNRITKTNVEKAKISIDQAKLSLKDTKTVLSQAVEQAYINVLNAQSQYDAALEELKAAQESYRIANEQLKLGAIATVDLIQQKNLYVQAMQSYVQAKYNAVLYVKIYEFYTGQAINL